MIARPAAPVVFTVDAFATHARREKKMNRRAAGCALDAPGFLQAPHEIAALARVSPRAMPACCDAEDALPEAANEDADAHATAGATTHTSHAR
jgi:hypothetical protein